MMSGLMLFAVLLCAATKDVETVELSGRPCQEGEKGDLPPGMVLCLGDYGANAAKLPTRIVGGEPTTINRYPTIVSVEFWIVNQNIWSHACGATILNNRYVLSAAHCFEGFGYSPSHRRVRLGTTYRHVGGTVINVIREINHPTWGLNFNDGDISVVLLSENIVYSDVIQQATIIAHGSTLPDNTDVTFAGWGSNSFLDGQSSEVLQHVTVQTINHDICSQRYGFNAVTNNMICAGILDVGGKDACQMDSGGPMYFGNIVAGVISWGAACGDSHLPGVVTKIASYTEWIRVTAV